MKKPKTKTQRRARRSFTPAFKVDAVRRVQGGTSASKVATDLDLTETAVGEWAERSDADAGIGDVGVLTSEERSELARLRKENKQLRMEREILEAAAPSSPRRTREVRVHSRVGGGLLRCRDVPRPRRLDERILRVADDAGVGPRRAQSRPSEEGARGLQGEPRNLRKPAHAPRAPREGRRGEHEEGREAHARRGARGAEEEAVPCHGRSPASSLAFESR